MEPEISSLSPEEPSQNHTLGQRNSIYSFTPYLYRGADKSLAPPGRKQAAAAEDF